MVRWEEVANYALSEAPASRAVALLHAMSAVEQALGNRGDETFANFAALRFRGSTISSAILVEAWNHRNQLAHYGLLPSYESVRHVLPTLAAAHAHLCGGMVAQLQSRLESLLPLERKIPRTKLLEVELAKDQAQAHNTVSLIRDHKDPCVAAVSLCIAASWTEKVLRPVLSKHNILVKGQAIKDLIKVAIGGRFIPGGPDWNAAVAVRNKVAHEGYVPRSLELEGAIEQFLSAAHALVSGDFTEQFHQRRKDAALLKERVARIRSSIGSLDRFGETVPMTIARLFHEAGATLEIRDHDLLNAFALAQRSSLLDFDLEPAEVESGAALLRKIDIDLLPVVEELRWRRDVAADLADYRRSVSECSKRLIDSAQISKRSLPPFDGLRFFRWVGTFVAVVGVCGLLHGCASGCSDDGMGLALRRSWAETLGAIACSALLGTCLYVTWYLVVVGWWHHRAYSSAQAATTTAKDEGDAQLIADYEALRKRRLTDARFATLIRPELYAGLQALQTLAPTPAYPRAVLWTCMSAVVILGLGAGLTDFLRMSPAWRAGIRVDAPEKMSPVQTEPPRIQNTPTGSPATAGESLSASLRTNRPPSRTNGPPKSQGGAARPPTANAAIPFTWTQQTGTLLSQAPSTVLFASNLADNGGYSVGRVESSAIVDASYELQARFDRTDSAVGTVEIVFLGGHFLVDRSRAYAFWCPGSPETWTGWTAFPAVQSVSNNIVLTQRGQTVAVTVNGSRIPDFVVPTPVTSGHIGLFFKTVVPGPGRLSVANLGFRAL